MHMTNKQLIKKWKRLSLKFKTEKITKSLSEMFLVCWGEKEIEMGDNKKEKVVIFDTGGEQGSPVLYCNVDKDNNCWAFAWNSKTNTFVKSNIGKFVKK